VELDGAITVVTGASRGIGAATARALSARGATVGLIARDERDLDTVRASLPGPSVAAPADVTDPEAVRAAFARITGEVGPVDVLVNNAGGGAYAAGLEEAPEQFEQQMRLNYLGTVHPTLAVLDTMASLRRGHVVNVASIAGRVGAPFEAAYSASKFAVVGFTEALTAEMAPFGVSFSLVDPGPVDTSFTEARGVPFQRRFPRPLTPEKVAGAIVSAVERDRFEQVLPRWLRIGIVTRAIAPGLYRRGLVNSTRAEAGRLVERFDERRR
jgi:short-subunit dehydrogenase